MCVPLSTIQSSRPVGSETAAYRLRRIFKRDGELCYWCQEDVACTVEHMVHRSRGGSNHLTNLKGACRACNAARATDEVPSKALVLKWKKKLNYVSFVKHANDRYNDAKMTVRSC